MNIKSRTALALLACFALAGCEKDACTKDSAVKAGDYFARCMAGDGYRRTSGADCGLKADYQRICVPVTAWGLKSSTE